MKPSRYLNQTVTVRRLLPPPPDDFYGEPVLGDPEAHPARKTVKQRQVRSANGAEVLASTEVWMTTEFPVGTLIDGEAVQDRENRVAKKGAVLFWKYLL